MKRYSVYFLTFIAICCSTERKHIAITDYKDVIKHEGTTVSITGIYTKSILALKPEQNKFNGRYKLKVNDSLEVIILPPYLATSVRPKEETDRLEGRKVRITGIIASHTYIEGPSLVNEPQSVSIPCFTSIKEIVVADL